MRRVNLIESYAPETMSPINGTAWQQIHLARDLYLTTIKGTAEGKPSGLGLTLLINPHSYIPSCIRNMTYRGRILTHKG